jgi:hypothetical protein
VNPLPLAGVQAVLDSAGSHARFDCLRTAENTELPGGEPSERIFFVW